MCCVSHHNSKQESRLQAFLQLLFFCNLKPTPSTSAAVLIACPAEREGAGSRNVASTRSARGHWFLLRQNERHLITALNLGVKLSPCNKRQKLPNMISYSYWELDPRLLTHSSLVCMHKEHKASSCLIHHPSLLKRWSPQSNTRANSVMSLSSTTPQSRKHTSTLKCFPALVLHRTQTSVPLTHANTHTFPFSSAPDKRGWA